MENRNHVEKADILIFDIQGRQLDHLQANTGETVRFGGSYMRGTYIVKVLPGTDRKILKAVKQ